MMNPYRMVLMILMEITVQISKENRVLATKQAEKGLKIYPPLTQWLLWAINDNRGQTMIHLERS